MKTWTVVIEINDNLGDGEAAFKKDTLECFISEVFAEKSSPGFSFRIMETIEAPYGPQHLDGVWIAERGATQPENYVPGLAGRIKS